MRIYMDTPHRIVKFGQQMNTFAHGRVSPGNDALANTIVYKLRRLAPAGAAMSYPFLLNGFHLAVSVPSGSLSIARIIGAALCLFATMAAPLIGLASVHRHPLEFGPGLRGRTLNHCVPCRNHGVHNVAAL
jgi:hypothetical protein